MLNYGIDIIKYNIIQNFKTNNLIIDIIIGFLFMLFIKYISSYDFFTKIIYLYEYFMNKNSIIVSFNSTETNTYWGLKMRGSDVFKAILFHIKQKISRNEVKNIKKIREFMLNNNDNDKDKNKDNLNEVLYIVDQFNEFQLIGKDEIDIYFSISYIISKNEDKKTNDKIYTLNLISKNINKESLSNIQKYVEKLINNYETLKSNELKNNLYIFQYEGFDDKNQIFKMYPFKTTCSIDKLYFDDKEKIMNQIIFFNNNKDWYSKRGKPYTLGICSYGEPGCGKTSFIKAIAKMLNRHIILVDISKIKYQKNADEIFFNEKINNIKIPYNKRIYVFPDFDCMTDLVNDRENKSINNNELIDLVKDKNSLKNILNNMNNDTLLNLSKLLNIFDGIPERTGQIIMMDTNHINNIDKALLRPGRIDCLIEFKKMNKKNIIKFINNHYDCNLDIKDIENIPDRKWTPAELFMKCTQNLDIKNLIKQLV
jgi:ATP-dependent 26S proteasome regulatory subunit